MIIQVNFKGKFYWNEDRKFAYRCDFPVQVGDLVQVPAKDEIKTVRVAEINVPESDIPANVLPLLKDAIGPAEYEGTIYDADPDAAAAGTVPALPEIEFAENIIVIKQLPIIEDQLRTLQEDVQKKVNEALSLAVTEDTVKIVKDVRASLRKEYTDLEARRKQVKQAILEPYNRFEATYNECIGNLYTNADKTLKEKIDAVENGIKDEKKARIREYYEEYRASIGLKDEEAAAFEKWPMNITKTESEKSLRTRAKAYLDIIRQSLIAIAGGQHPDEMLMEFRICGDLAKATAIVNERHRKIEEEKKRREAEAAARAEREAREREVVAKVEAAIQKAEPLEPPVMAKPEKDPNEVFALVGPFVLKNVTRAQVIKFKQFLNQEGIQYGKP